MSTLALLILITVLWTVSMIFLIYLFYIRPFIDERQVSRGLSLTQYRVKVPKASSQESPDPKELIAVMEQMYAGFSFLKTHSGWKRFRYGNPHISLEIVSPTERDEINFYIGVPRGYESIFEKQLHGLFHNAELEQITDYNVLTEQGQVKASYVTLKEDSILPIRTYQELETDPLGSLTSALSKIQSSESAVIQVLIQKAPQGWGQKGRKLAKTMQKEGLDFKQAQKEVNKNIFQSIFQEFKKSNQKVEDMSDNQLTQTDQTTIQGIESKIGKTGFKTNIRLMTIADSDDRAEMLLDQVKGSFSQFASENWNTFQIKDYKKGKIGKFLYKFIFRVFDEKEEILLNAEELTSVFHLPTPLLETPKVQWVTSKASHPPVNLPDHGLLIGKNKYRGEENEVRIKPADRRRHMYLIGQTGTGKTSMMKKMIEGDLRAGRGVGLLDPNGDFAEEVLGMVPQDRVDDVIYFNPQDLEYPLGLNVLEAKTEEEKDFMSQEMMSIFYSIVSDPSMIGPLFEHNMRMAMAALMSDIKNPYTIVEIPKLFTDDEFRAKVLKTVKDPVVKDFWEKEFPASQKGQQAGDVLGYLLSKLGRFIENEMVRNIIGQQYSSVDFQDIMDSNKIIIANLSKGAIGDMNSKLLGMLLVSKLQAAAFKRATIPEDQRQDFYLYLDEFQNFTTDSISTILSEARKYRLNMVLAHQFIGQLPEDIRNAVFGNVGTNIAFRIGYEDAEFLEPKMQPAYTAQDLSETDNLNAVVKLMIDGKTSKAFNTQVIFADREDPQLQKAVKELSRLRHGTKSTIVEMDMKHRR